MDNPSLDSVFVTLHAFLESRGWKLYENVTHPNMFFRIDPLTGQSYRCDHAFTIESDRMVWEKCLRREWLKTQKIESK